MMHWTTIERDSSTNVVAPADDDSRTTDCQQDEFRCGRGPLTFERVRAAMGARMRERAGISKAMRARLLSTETAVGEIRFGTQRRHRRSHPVSRGRYGVLEDEAAGAARDPPHTERDDCILRPHQSFNRGPFPNGGAEVRRGPRRPSGGA